MSVAVPVVAGVTAITVSLIDYFSSRDKDKERVRALENELNETRRQKASMEEEYRRREEQSYAQRVAMQSEAAEKEQKIRDEMRKIEKEQLKMRQEQTKEYDEHGKAYEAQIKEKNDELESVRVKKAKELEALAKTQEEERREHFEELSKMEEKIAMLSEKHTETVQKLLEDKNEEVKGLVNRITAVKTAGCETMAVAFGMFNNVVAMNPAEEAATIISTKIGIVLQAVSKMDDQRRAFDDWMIDNDIEKNASRAQFLLESMNKDCSHLKTLIQELFTLVSNTAFAHDLTEKAKEALNAALRNISYLFEEITKLRKAVATPPRSITVDVMKKCLDDITQAVKNVPRMVTQTMKEYVQEGMKMLDSNRQNYMNAIASNGGDTLTIEEA